MLDNERFLGIDGLYFDAEWDAELVDKKREEHFIKQSRIGDLDSLRQICDLFCVGEWEDLYVVNIADDDEAALLSSCLGTACESGESYILGISDDMSYGGIYSYGATRQVVRQLKEIIKNIASKEIQSREDATLRNYIKRKAREVYAADRGIAYADAPQGYMISKFNVAPDYVDAVLYEVERLWDKEHKI